MDGLDLQRLITALLMPLPLGLVLASAGLILLAASRWRRGGWWRGRAPPSSPCCVTWGYPPPR